MTNDFGYLKTEAKFLNWLRSSLRSVWTKHPVKLAMISKGRYKKIVNGRSIWHITCEKCGKPTKQGDIEVNHKQCAGKFNLENFGEFAERLLLVEKTDLELLCKKCHSVITYSERHAVSLEEARSRKAAIQFSKLPEIQQQIMLQELGIDYFDTVTERKEAFLKFIHKENSDGDEVSDRRNVLRQSQVLRRSETQGRMARS